MAIPKLALIPSGVKAGKLYSVLPTNGDGDFTTTRNTVATRVNENGLIEEVASNVPRLDYSDGGCPSLLLEPQRTNLLTYSSGFVTDWNNTNIIINSNSITSPDGNLNATKFIPNTTSGGHYLDRSGVSVSNNALSSIFAKKGEYKRFSIRSYFSGANAIFDVNDGVIISESSVTAKIEDYGNGWYRCSLNEIGNANYGYGIFVMEDNSTNPLDTYVANGVDGIYFYGASLEIGSFVTSYIPTTNSAVTRSADTANGAGNASTFNSSEGVLMIETTFKQLTRNNLITLTNGQVSNIVQIFADTNSKKELRFYLSFGGTNIAPSTVVAINEIEEYNKISIKYKSGSTKVYINGFLKLNITTAFSGASFDRLHLSQYNESLPFVGSTKQIQYYDSALNDTDLEKITSWTSFTAMANAQSYTII